MKSADPFHILGLQPGTPRDEVRRAYRKLAMRWHPDRNQHSGEAEERFKHIKAAYELAIDPAAYAAWLEWQAAEPAIRTPDEAASAAAAPIEQTLELTLEEVARGGCRTIRVERPVFCVSCKGQGRVSHPFSMPCARCNGVGRLRGKRFAGLEHCPGCAGRGYVRDADCPDCRGHGSQTVHSVFEVRIPVGLRHGETLRLARREGSILLRIAHRPHPFFTLDGDDLHCTVPVDVLALIAGGEIEVPTLDEVIRLPLPAAAGAAEVRVAKRGLPRRHGKGAGDLVLHLQAVFPSNLTPSEAARLRQFAAGLARHAASRSPVLHDWAVRLEQRKLGQT